MSFVAAGDFTHTHHVSLFARRVVQKVRDTVMPFIWVEEVSYLTHASIESHDQWVVITTGGTSGRKGGQWIQSQDPEQAGDRKCSHHLSHGLGSGDLFGLHPLSVREKEA